MSEKEIRLQFMRYPFMFSKLLTIISSEGMQTVRNRLEQLNFHIAHLVGSPSINFAQQGEARHTFCQGDNSLAMSFAKEDVHFPITNPQMLCDDFWFIFNAHPVRKLSATVIAAVAFGLFLLAA